MHKERETSKRKKSVCSFLCSISVILKVRRENCSGEQSRKRQSRRAERQREQVKECGKIPALPPDETSNLSSGKCCGRRPLIRGRRFFAFLREFIIRHIKDRGLNDERSGKQRPVQTIWRQMVQNQHSRPEKAVRLSCRTRERRATRGVAGAACHGANMGRAITRIF